MSYIGRDIRTGAFRQLDDISSGFDGSDTTHTMQVNSTNVSVGDVNQILLSLGGVIQKPGTDFTVSGSTLTFTTAPAANTSFFAILLGSDNGGTVTPTDGSVTDDKLADIISEINNTGGDLTVDVSGEINLDADGGKVRLKDAGTEVARFVLDNGSGDLEIVSSISDKDIKFKGIDGGSNVTAMTIDMSAAGRVGIGTTSPARALHVNSTEANVASFEGHQGEGLVISSATNGRIDLIGYDDGASAYNKMVIRSTGSGDQITLHTDGYVTKPLQPAFRVTTTDQGNLSNNTYHTITFGSGGEAFDNHSDFDTSTYTFTAPVTGKYMFGVGVMVTTLQTDASYYGIRLTTSNYDTWSYLLDPGGFDETVSYFNMNVPIITDMDANDTAIVRYYQGHGTGGVSDINSGSWFSGMLIG